MLFTYLRLEPEHAGRDDDRRAVLRRMTIHRLGGPPSREFADHGRATTGFKDLTAVLLDDPPHALVTLRVAWLGLGGLPALVRWLDLMAHVGTRLITVEDGLDSVLPSSYGQTLALLCTAADQMDLMNAQAIGRYGKNGGRPPKNDDLTPAVAANLVAKHGSIQAAVRASTYSYGRLRRMYQRYSGQGL